jgi:hypothetical protein
MIRKPFQRLPIDVPQACIPRIRTYRWTSGFLVASTRVRDLLVRAKNLLERAKHCPGSANRTEDRVREAVPFEGWGDRLKSQRLDILLVHSLSSGNFHERQTQP